MKRYLAYGLGAFVLLVAGVIIAAQVTSTYKQTTSGRFVEAQLFRCDESASITGEDTPIGGDADCASAAWTNPVNCNGYSTIGVWFFEYGGGSGEAKIWNCIAPIGFESVGAQAPVTAISASLQTGGLDDQFCVDLLAGAGVTMIGTTAGVQYWSDGPIDLGFIVGEVQDCTGDCDSTLVVRCSGGR